MAKRPLLQSSSRDGHGEDHRERMMMKKKKLRTLREVERDEELRASRETERIEEEPEKGEGEMEEEESDDVYEVLEPIGEVVFVSDTFGANRNHYNSFAADGEVYELGDTVFFNPENKLQRPHAAIIKEITQDTDGNMFVNCRWFYRPEEAFKESGGNWPAQDRRELFYSFHNDEVPAGSVKHKCVVHFVPLHKQLPVRSVNPGFIVQRFYDFTEKRLWSLTKKNFPLDEQVEIDMLFQKTEERLKQPQDIELEWAPACKDDLLNNKWNHKKNTIHPIDVLGVGPTIKYVQPMKEKTIKSSPDFTNYLAILSRYKKLTGTKSRDKWLERLLQVIHLICVSPEDQRKANDVSFNHITSGEDDAKNVMGSKDRSPNDVQGHWPNVAVRVVTELERLCCQTHANEKRYDQKMRHLHFNLKNNDLLAKRLLNEELEPRAILDMSPDELKKRHG